MPAYNCKDPVFDLPRLAELVRQSEHLSMLTSKDVVRHWFEARQGTSSKVFIMEYNLTQRFPLSKSLNHLPNQGSHPHNKGPCDSLNIIKAAKKL